MADSFESLARALRDEALQEIEALAGNVEAPARRAFAAARRRDLAVKAGSSVRAAKRWRTASVLAVAGLAALLLGAAVSLLARSAAPGSTTQRAGVALARSLDAVTMVTERAPVLAARALSQWIEQPMRSEQEAMARQATQLLRRVENRAAPPLRALITAHRRLQRPPDDPPAAPPPPSGSAAQAQPDPRAS